METSVRRTRSIDRSSRTVRWTGWASLSAALLLSACSPSEPVIDHSEPNAPTIIEAPASVSVSARSVWGSGRAQIAIAGAADDLVVATMTGLYHVTSATQQPTLIDSVPLGAVIGTMAVDASGGLLAVAYTSPASVAVYELDRGVQLAEHRLESPARSVTFTGDGALVVDTYAAPLGSSGPDATPTSVLEPDDASAGASAVLADGTVVAGLASSATVAFARDGRVRTTVLDVPAGAMVQDVRLSPDRRTLAVSVAVTTNDIDRSDRIVLIDAASMATRATIDTGTLLDLSMWALGNTTVLVDDGSVAAWNLDGRPREESGPARGAATQLVATGAGIVTSHADGSLVIWPDDAPPVMADSGIEQVSLTVAVDDTRVVGVDRYGAITSWSVSDGASLGTDRRFATGELTAVAASDDGLIAVTSTLGTATVLDAALTVSAEFAVTSDPSSVSSVAFDPASHALAAGLAERVRAEAFDDTVSTWDLSTGRAVFSAGGESEDVAGCAFYFSRVRYSPDGSVLATSSHDFSVEVLDAETGRMIEQLTSTSTLLDMAFTPDGERLVATYDDATVNVWNTSDFSLETSYQGALGGYFAIAPLPDNATLIVADITGAISAIDLTSGATRYQFGGSSYRTTSLALSPDGTLLAAPSAGGSISIWSADGGQSLATAAGHAGDVTAVDFLHTGTAIVTVAADGTARTWDVERSGA